MKFFKTLTCVVLPLMAGCVAAAMDFSFEDKVYTQVGGGYISDNNFHGGGVMLRAGYNFTELLGWSPAKGQHNVEIEADFLWEQATASSYIPDTVVTFKYGQTQVVTPASNVTQSRKGEVNMYPIMLNYRYVWQARNGMVRHAPLPWWAGFGVYLGAGVGVNIVNTEDEYSFLAVPVSSGLTNAVSKTYSSTEGEFAGQVFAGGSYYFTDRFGVTGGGRLLFTASQSFGNLPFNNNDFATPGLDTDVMQWLLEGAVTYTW